MNVQTWRTAYTRPETWRFLTALALMMMEVTVVALWYQALMRPEGILFAALFGELFAAQFASYLIARGMEHMHWSMAVRRIAFLLWLIAAVLLTMKLILFVQQAISFLDLASLPVRYILLPNVDGRSFFHLVIIIVLISRGVSLASKMPALRSVQISFQLWLMLVLFYGTVFAPFHPREAAAGLYIFLFAGLTSMSTARINSLSELHGGKVPRFGGGWLSGILLAGLFIVGVAILLGWVASSQVVALLTRVFIAILAILTAAGLWILMPLFSWLARVLPEIIDQIGKVLKSISGLRLPPALENLVGQIGQVFEKAIPAIFAGRIILLLAIVALVVFSILAGLRLSKQYNAQEEDQVNLAEAEDAGSRWPRWLQQALSTGFNLRLHSPAKLLAAARIRNIYRQLMALSKKMGQERPASLTPIEFLPSLDTLFPEEGDSLEHITAAYVKVRYGAYPETNQEVAAVEAAWEAVRKQGKVQLAARKRRGSQ